MLVTIVSPDEYLPVSVDKPAVGRTYTLEDADSPTSRQNRAFHALVQEYWRSGAHSYKARSFAEFRNVIKRDLGAGFESYDYADVINGQVKMFRRVKREEIPAHVWDKREFAVRGNLKSWSDYTKKQRTETIDRLIAEMHEAGVKTKKFYEILGGLEEGNHAAG